MAGTTACVFVFSVLLELILCGAESSQVHGTRNPREFFFSSTVRLHRFDSQTTDQNRLGGRTTNGMESSQSTRGEGGGGSDDDQGGSKGPPEGGESREGVDELIALSSCASCSRCFVVLPSVMESGFVFLDDVCPRASHKTFCVAS